MGEFRRIAEKIARILEEIKHDGKVSPKDISAIIPEVIGENIRSRSDNIEANIPAVMGGQAGDSSAINFYPYGKPGLGCCDFSLFLALQTSAYIKPGQRGHMNCKDAIQKIVQHMQGNCFQKTHAAVLITDYWDGNAFEDWKGNIKQIKNHAQIEIYLLAGGKVSEINI